mmetsp:Transcript_65938/g.182256  ORF Transcript_65938/g.182256 Transcript_65938/m.182256 type:complete len:228 (+) Transcript_65938:179-862(+)
MLLLALFRAVHDLSAGAALFESSVVRTPAARALPQVSSLVLRAMLRRGCLGGLFLFEHARDLALAHRVSDLVERAFEAIGEEELERSMGRAGLRRHFRLRHRREEGVDHVARVGRGAKCADCPAHNHPVVRCAYMLDDNGHHPLPPGISEAHGPYFRRRPGRPCQNLLVDHASIGGRRHQEGQRRDLGNPLLCRLVVHGRFPPLPHCLIRGPLLLGSHGREGRLLRR